jgi:hypothetical protein
LLFSKRSGNIFVKIIDGFASVKLPQTSPQKTEFLVYNECCLQVSVGDFNTMLHVDWKLSCAPTHLCFLFLTFRVKWCVFLSGGEGGISFAVTSKRDEQFLLRRTMKICEKCQGAMVVERAVDLEVGLSILYFACLNCGKRIQAEKEPRPLVS